MKRLPPAVPDDILRAHRAFRVFVESDLREATTPLYLRVCAKVQERQWEKYLDSLSQMRDWVLPYFSGDERDVGNMQIAGSAALILAYERITGRESSARRIFARPLKTRHLALPVALGAIAVGAGFVLMQQR